MFYNNIWGSLQINVYRSTYICILASAPDTEYQSGSSKFQANMYTCFQIDASLHTMLINVFIIKLMLVRGNVYVSLLSDVLYAELACLRTGCWSDQRAHSPLWAQEERQAIGYPHAAWVWLTAPNAACDVWLTLTIERVWCSKLHVSGDCLCWLARFSWSVDYNKSVVFAAVSQVSALPENQTSKWPQWGLCHRFRPMCRSIIIIIIIIIIFNKKYSFLWELWPESVALTSLNLPLLTTSRWLTHTSKKLF